MQRRFAVLIVAAQDLELGMKHRHLAGVAVELDFAEECDLHPFPENFGEVSSVKPLPQQDGARGVGESRFEEPQVAALESGELGGADIRDHGRHLPRREWRDGLDVAAVLVAKGHVPDQVLDRDQSLGLEHLRARMTDAFNEREGSGQVHAGSPTVYNALVKLSLAILA